MKTQSTLITLKVLTWFAFVGMLIKAGSTVFLLVYSLWHPEVIKTDLILFLLVMGFQLLKVAMVWIILEGMNSVNLEAPFTGKLATILRYLSAVIASAGIVALIHIAVRSHMYDGPILSTNIPPASEYLFLAGLVFLISELFRRGVELQTENELTV